MRLLVTLQGRFLSCRGRVYSHHLTYERFARRYLDVFEELWILARCHEVAEVPEGWGQADGPGVTFVAAPAFRGPWQYLRRRTDLRRRVQAAVQQCDAHLFRMAGPLGLLAWRTLPPGRPFAVEVVADPWLVLAPGSVRSVARPWVRRYWTRCLRRQCREAAAVAYVTERVLQVRYPAGPDAVTAHYSSVELGDADFCEDLEPRRRRLETLPMRPAQLGFVGSLSQGHKLPHVHLQALALLLRRGRPAHLHLVGQGDRRAALEAQVRRQGLGDHVTFHGPLPGGRAVLEAMDRFDLLLNATAAEGLPRVVIEAMARGCPCVASAVGGTVELLEPEFLVPPFRAEALAAALERLLADPGRLWAAVQRHRDVARRYHRDVLQPRRRRFYQAFRRRCAEAACP